MKFNIISIGKFGNSSYQDLYFEYKKRLKYDVSLIELVLKKHYTNIDDEKKEEGKLLLSKCDADSMIISLDERGKIITTNEFCTQINSYINLGIMNINFIIGGAYGLSQEVIKNSNYILSLGKMVFPHLMVRVILIEQLYRVWTLNNNHPYHK